VRLVSLGVAYYHASLPQGVKDLLIGAYRSGAVDVLVATSSLAVRRKDGTHGG